MQCIRRTGNTARCQISTSPSRVLPLLHISYDSASPYFNFPWPLLFPILLLWDFSSTSLPFSRTTLLHNRQYILRNELHQHGENNSLSCSCSCAGRVFWIPSIRTGTPGSGPCSCRFFRSTRGGVTQCPATSTVLVNVACRGVFFLRLIDSP